MPACQYRRDQSGFIPADLFSVTVEPDYKHFLLTLPVKFTITGRYTN